MEPVPTLDFTRPPLFTAAVVAGSIERKIMRNVHNAAFELIAIDGSRAYFVDNTLEGQTFEEFETLTGLSHADLEHADRTKATVYIEGKYYTVGRIVCAA